MKIIYLNIILHMNIIMIYAILTQLKIKQILFYKIEEKNILIKIYLYVKKIVNLKILILVMKRLNAIALLKIFFILYLIYQIIKINY